MQKLQEHRTRVPIPTFGYRFEVVITNDIMQSIQKRFPSYNDPDSDAVHYKVRGKSISWLFYKNDISAGTIVHEAWHGVHAMLSYVGAGLDDEVVAYHLGYLVDFIVRDYNKWKEKCSNESKTA